MIMENIYQAKTHLSRLVDEALEGKDVVIARSGRPLVRMIPYEENPGGLNYGLMKGQVRISDDFDKPVEIDEMFKEYRPK